MIESIITIVLFSFADLSGRIGLPTPESFKMESNRGHRHCLLVQNFVLFKDFILFMDFTHDTVKFMQLDLKDVTMAEAKQGSIDLR